MPLSVNSFLNEVEEIKNKVTALSSKKIQYLALKPLINFLLILIGIITKKSGEILLPLIRQAFPLQN